MVTLTEAQIREMVQQMDCGFRGYYHQHTGELLFVPDTLRNPYFETELFEEDIKKWEDNQNDFVEIATMDSSRSFEIMAAFAEQLDLKNPLKGRLINALGKRKPFREFKSLIDFSGPYRQQWFQFREARIMEWVKSQLK